MPLSEIEIVQGAAMILAKKLCIETNATKSSITIGGMQAKDGSGKPKNFRVTVAELSDEEVEHYQKDQEVIS